MKKRTRTNGGNKSGNKRSKAGPPALTVNAGEVVFRLLCPVALSGGLIGKSGNIVQNLQTLTNSKIRVEEVINSTDTYRAVIVIGNKKVDKKIQITVNEKNEETESEIGGNDNFEVSSAQEAVLKVFERMVEVMEETKEDVKVVTFRMLAETSQVGGVIGKGGKVIQNIRKDSLCKIRVSDAGGNLPACALSNEQMLEMEGNVLAVKRALLAITSRLQECPPLETAIVSGNRPYQTTPYSNFPSSDTEYPPDRRPVYSSRGQHSTDTDPRSKQEVVFRILCSKDRIGGVIGKGGTIVNALQKETGATITAGGSVPGCDERLITITTKENPDSQFSPAQNAIVLVFNRSIEAGYEKGLQSAGNKIVSARLVVPTNEVGCLIGNGGSVISNIRMTTGAGIRIVEHDQLPRCATENDEVVEITGEFVNVQDALFNVTSRLRQSLFSYSIPNDDRLRTNSVIPEMSIYGRERDPTLRPHASLGISPTVNPQLRTYSVIPEMNIYGREKDPTFKLHTSVGISPTVNPHAVFSQNIDHLRAPYSYDRSFTSMPWASQAVGVNPRGMMAVGSGPVSVKGGIELGSGSRSAIVTNTTVEIVIPNNVIGSVYGENGSHLARLRQISGAKVAVHEPRPGTGDWTVVISGTPDETQAAQSLVQAFILTGRS